jgi:hypothetical protein
MALIDGLGKDTAGIIVGGAELFVCARNTTTPGTVGTLFSVGYTLNELSFDPTIEDMSVDVEQRISPANSFIVGSKMALNVDLAQNNLQNMRLAMALSSANLTGSANGALLTFNDPSDENLQAQFVVKGPGTGTTHAGTLTDTYTFWNCKARLKGPITFGKKIVQKISLSLIILPEDLIGTTEFVKGLYGKRALA